MFRDWRYPPQDRRRRARHPAFHQSLLKRAFVSLRLIQQFKIVLPKFKTGTVKYILSLETFVLIVIKKLPSLKMYLVMTSFASEVRTLYAAWLPRFLQYDGRVDWS